MSQDTDLFLCPILRPFLLVIKCIAVCDKKKTPLEWGMGVVGTADVWSLSARPHGGMAKCHLLLHLQRLLSQSQQRRKWLLGETAGWLGSCTAAGWLGTEPSPHAPYTHFPAPPALHQLRAAGETAGRWWGVVFVCVLQVEFGSQPQMTSLPSLFLRPLFLGYKSLLMIKNQASRARNLNNNLYK